MRDQIVILAAGKGTRMGGAVPKVLVMLYNKPLILYLLGEIEKINQLAKPVVVVGYKAEKVKAVLGEDFIYALQDKQLGTAHALLSARHKIKGKNILVLYGDMPFVKAESLKKLITSHHKHQSHLSMLTAAVPNFEGIFKSLNQFGRIVRDSKNQISKIIEHKDATEEQKQILEINPGIYMFNCDWLWKHIEKIENKNQQQEYYLTDIAEVAIKSGVKIVDVPMDPKEALGINSPQDLKFAEKLI